MIVLLDADVCIDFTRGRTPIVDRLRSRETVRWGVSAVVLFELERGAHFAPSPRAERARIDLLAELLTVVLPFDASAARACARLASDMRAQPIGPRDLMTAATALVHDCAVATRNVREFSRVPGLQVEDWSVPA